MICSDQLDEGSIAIFAVKSAINGASSNILGDGIKL